MSHQTEIKEKIADGDAVKKVLKELGFEVLENQKWRGYYGLSDKVADIIGRHPRCPYDVAFVRGEDGNYILSADFWEHVDMGHVTMGSLIGDGGAKFIQGYNVEVGSSAAFADGYTLSHEEVYTDGTIVHEYEIDDVQLLALTGGGDW